MIRAVAGMARSDDAWPLWVHEQTSRNVRVMSFLPLKADIRQREWHVRYVPTADIVASSTFRLLHDVSPWRGVWRAGRY